MEVESVPQKAECSDDVDSPEEMSSSEVESDLSDADVSSPEETLPSEVKAGLSDVLGGILRKKTGGDDVILSKGRSDRLLNKAKAQKQLAEKDADDPSSQLPQRTEKQQKKHLWEEMGRVKPDITKKMQERHLQRLATRGVVQLFNAVRKQQKMTEDPLDARGPASRKKLGKAASTKTAFMDILKSTATGGTVVKSEPLDDNAKVALNSGSEKPTWSVLSDDFMMRTGMKDWDKDLKSDNSDDDGGGSLSDGSMSDQ